MFSFFARGDHFEKNIRENVYKMSAEQVCRYDQIGHHSNTVLSTQVYSLDSKVRVLDPLTQQSVYKLDLDVDEAAICLTVPHNLWFVSYHGRRTSLRVVNTFVRKSGCWPSEGQCLHP